MKRIMKYYKSFLAVLILAVCLLFLEAICDLKLPDFMADIVNVGIQTNGIEDVTPKAISEKGIALMKTFMTEEQKEQIASSYSLVEKGDKEYLEEYPLIQEQNIYVLNENADISELNKIFATSSEAFILLLQSLNTTEIETQDNSANMNITEIYSMLPMLENISQEQIYTIIDKAQAQSEETSTQVGKVFTKAFYEELGVNMQQVQFNYILVVGLKMLGITLLGAATAITVDLLSARIGAGIGRKLRRKLFEKVESFSNVEFNKFGEASLITRTTNDVTQIQNITTMGIRMIVYAPIMGIGALIMMLGRTTEMTWTLALGCGLIFLTIVILFKIALPKIKVIQKLTDKLNLVSRENLSGIMVIRAFGTQKHEEERFDKVNKDLTKINLFVMRAMSITMPGMMLIMNLLSVLIIWVGSYQIAEATIQVGDLMAMMQYAIQVIMSFLVLSMIFIMLPRASVSAERIADVLETENTIKNPKEPKKFDKNKIGYVEFKNVSFQYEAGEEMVLDNISFIAKPGETTAFIGATGSGKSTLVQLIPRFYDAVKGEVLVNGVNVKDMNLDDLHLQIGYVPQKGNLLSGTIESNLKYGNKEIDDEFMKKCAEIAQATEFIETKEDKYNSSISQGAKNVSGGQRQRLSIARALVTQAPIYIFDDSFSALDYKTDSKLRNALKENSKDATVLIVAQRVSTIMNADQIIVLDNGKIIGKGKHEELLENCELYKEIVYSQLSKEEAEGKKNA